MVRLGKGRKESDTKDRVWMPAPHHAASSSPMGQDGALRAGKKRDRVDLGPAFKSHRANVLFSGQAVVMPKAMV